MKQNNSNPQNAGYPQMNNLMVYWMQMAGIKKEQIEEHTNNYLQEMLIQCFDPQKADKIFSEAHVNDQILFVFY